MASGMFKPSHYRLINTMQADTETQLYPLPPADI